MSMFHVKHAATHGGYGQPIHERVASALQQGPQLEVNVPAEIVPSFELSSRSVDPLLRSSGN